MLDSQNFHELYEFKKNGTAGKGYNKKTASKEA